MSIASLFPTIRFSDSPNFFIIAGPCVVENELVCMTVAEELTLVAEKYKLPLIFKASYKKANRSRLDSFSGIGDEDALEILASIRDKFSVPVITDVHTPSECAIAAQYVDALQIPAFLCRQTDLLVAAANTGKVVNIKKGQFLAADMMKFATDKVSQSGNNKIMVTERGAMFGYNDLVVDFRGIPIMQQFGYPVVLDITHSVQQPNQSSGVSGGMPEMIETLAKAGIAVGADGLFLETHPVPEKALSDGTTMIKLSEVENLLAKLLKIRETINKL